MPPPWTRAGDDEWLFDEYLPPDLQLKAFVHFTPIPIARRAARLLAPRSGMRILDVGSGAGKFCIIAAHELPNATLVGVEQRKHLVHVATRLAERWCVANTTFIHGDAFALDWSDFDAFYFFNPFAEQLFQPCQVLDATIEHGPKHYIRYLAATYDRLAKARAGTRVVTHHGLGTPLPMGYERAPDSPSLIEHRALDQGALRGCTNHKRLVSGC